MAGFTNKMHYNRWGIE